MFSIENSLARQFHLKLKHRLSPGQSWLLAAFLFLPLLRAGAAGTWTPLSNSPPTGVNEALLMSDGTILTDDGSGDVNKLTPDIHGSYINGTWTQLTSMNNARLFFSTELLTNGNVYVAGGEYGAGDDHAEFYDPLRNVWTKTPDPIPSVGFSDAESKTLPNGNVLQSDSQSGYWIYNTASNLLTHGGSCEDMNETCWVRLPNNNVLAVTGYSTTSEHYVPSSNTWYADNNVPVPVFGSGGELGAAFALPNGTVFQIGATNNTAIYTPGATVTSAGSWVAGPHMNFGTNQLGAVDAPAAMMVNGKILCALGPESTPGFNGPVFFVEYDYTVNSFTQVTAPGGGSTYNNTPYATSMLDLPDGTVLFIGGQNSTSLYVYTPTNSVPLAIGQPAIYSLGENPDGSFYLTGTNLNGISEGAAYGDDEQMNSNYPLVRMTNSVTGNVYYARTFNWNSVSIQTGSNVLNTEFSLPQNLPAGTYSLVVVANGNPSAPTNFTYSPPPVPTGLTAIGGSSGTNGFVSLSWNASAGTMAYDVKQSSTLAGYFATIATVSGLVYTNNGLTNGLPWYYRVSAVGVNGPSTNSNPVSATPNGAPLIPGATSVNLASYYNRGGIYSDGRSFSGGIDSSGSALSANLLAPSFSWNSLNFNFGPSNALDVVSCASQVITLPAGRFNTLQILGLAVNGSQTAQTFTVTYTDNSTATFTQSFSDWANHQLYAGEVPVLTMPYRDNSSGGSQRLNLTLNGYVFTLDQTKTVKSITVPGNSNVILLAMTLATDMAPVSLAAYCNRAGIYTDGTIFTNNPPTVGLDGDTNAYSATLLGTSQTWTNTLFTFGQVNVTNVISCASQTISLPPGNYSRLRMLATGINGAQTSQSFVVTYSDATTATFSQSLSDWATPQNYTGESQAVPMSQRNEGNGKVDKQTFYAYGYSFTLNNTKKVQSVRLPNNANVVVSAISLVPNFAPTFNINPLALTNANASHIYSGNIATNANDLNGDALTFAKVSGPAWLSVAANGTFSGIPSNANANSNTFVLSVTDSGGLSNTATLNIYVNGSPSFTNNPFTMPFAVPGVSYSGTIATNASDPNPGDTLAFGLVSGPAWLSVAPNGALSGTPSISDLNSNIFVVSVTDPSGLSNTATMNIYVDLPPSFTLSPFTLPMAGASSNYSGTIATNATDPNTGDVLTFALVSGPSWLNVAANGSLSGVPSNANTNLDTFVVSVTDSSGLSNTATLYISVEGAPYFTVNSIYLPEAQAGQSYGGNIGSPVIDPNNEPVTYGLVSGPAWLSMATNGMVSGIPSNANANTNTFVVSATDSDGLFGTATLYIYVNGAPSFTTNPFTASFAPVNQAYSNSIAANASDPNPGDTLTFALVSGPAWLSVATNGIISGSPTNSDLNTNTFVVSVTDPSGLSNTATMYIYVDAPPAFTTNPFILPAAYAGRSYAGMVATNATDPNTNDVLTFALVSGPAWLNVATNGVLSGVPSAANTGTNMFLLSVTDPSGLSNTATLYIYVNGPPSFAPNPFTLAEAQAGQSYGSTIAPFATDPNPGVPLVNFGLISGPSWLSVATNGAVSGVPSNANANTNTFVVSVTDSNGLSASATMYIYVNGSPSFTTNSFALPFAVVAQAYSNSIASRAFDPNPGDVLTLAKVSGPAWLNVATNGILSGTPAITDLNTNTFVVSVTDPSGLSNTATMYIYVDGPPSFTANPFALPTAEPGQSYAGTVATNATDPNTNDVLTFVKVSGPAWLNLAANGAVSGTPSTANAGTNMFLLSVADPDGLSNTATLYIYVNGPPSFPTNPFTLTEAQAGQSYGANLAAYATDTNPGVWLLAFGLVSGPSWLSVATNGMVSGVPSNANANANTFVVSVTDSNGLSSTATMYVYVNGSPSFITNSFATHFAVVNQAYAASIASNAVDPNPGDTLAFAKVSGPAWLNVATNGTLSGSPSVSDVNTNAFVVSVTDPSGLSNTATLYIYVDGPPSFTVNPFALPMINAGQNYAGTVATNATDPNTNDVLTFARVSGPAWLNVAANGTLSGIPANANANTNTFLLSVTDLSGLSNTATLYIYVNGAPLFTVNPFTLPAIVAGQNYTGTIATNATDPNPGDVLTFALVNGPAWLTVGTNGMLSGMPISVNVGNNSFLVSVTDPGGLSNSATLFIPVTSAPAIISGMSAQPGGLLLLSWSGGIAPYQVQSADDLFLGDWQNLGGTITNNSLSITPTNSAIFYRVFGQ